VPRAHLFGGQQSSCSQPSIAALQIEGLPDVRDLFEVERFILPGPPPLPVQDLRYLAITVMVQQRIDLGDDFRLGLPNLSDRQRFGQSEASGGATAEANMDLDRLSVD